jgi:carboxylesterase type B
VLGNSAKNSRCPGKQLLAGKTYPSSEGCMTVNIFRQKPKDGERVPVAVYIHGGAFNRGSCKFSGFFTSQPIAREVLEVFLTDRCLF